MVNAKGKALQVLREGGYRVTRVRKALLTLLEKANRPMSIADLAHKAPVDEASVYRSISLFLELEIVEEIVEQGQLRRYALTDGTHHHHIICTTCGYVTHIPCEGGRLQKVQHEKFPAIFAHDITLYGTCQACI